MCIYIYIYYIVLRRYGCHSNIHTIGINVFSKYNTKFPLTWQYKTRDENITIALQIYWKQTQIWTSGWWLQRANLWLARRPWKATLLTKIHIFAISCLTHLGKTIPGSKTSVIREAFSRVHRSVHPRVLCVHECYFAKRGTMPPKRIFTRFFLYPCQVSSTI